VALGGGECRQLRSPRLGYSGNVGAPSKEAERWSPMAASRSGMKPRCSNLKELEYGFTMKYSEVLIHQSLSDLQRQCEVPPYFAGIFSEMPCHKLSCCVIGQTFVSEVLVHGSEFWQPVLGTACPLQYICVYPSNSPRMCQSSCREIVAADTWTAKPTEFGTIRSEAGGNEISRRTA
jgi:hypothetical protein